MKTTLALFALCLSLLVLPLQAAENISIRYTIKNIIRLEHGYQADLSVVVYNNSANAYVDVQLLPQNIHLLDNNGVDNTLNINTLPANTFIRHKWTITTAEPLDNAAGAPLYVLLNGIDNLGAPVSLPLRALREAQ